MTFARLGIVFKARNLAADPRCAVAAPLEGFDVTSAVAPEVHQRRRRDQVVVPVGPGAL